MTQGEYRAGADFMGQIGINCPLPHELIRGAIIGAACLVEIVDHHESPWFFGPLGLVLTGAVPTTPIPCVGELGFFAWKPSGDIIAPPALWMRPVEPAHLPLIGT